MLVAAGDAQKKNRRALSTTTPHLIARATARRNSGQSECKVSPQYIHRARATPYLWQSRSKRSLRQPMSASPWSIEEHQESFIVKDANGQQLAYLYFEDEPQRQMSMKRLSRDEAFLIAVNIAKLPSVPRQILKDIPRPPNSASWED